MARRWLPIPDEDRRRGLARIAECRRILAKGRGR